MSSDSKLPEGWVETSLGEVVTISSSKRIFHSEYVQDGIPFYRSKEIIEKYKGNKVSTALFIPEEKFKEINNKFGSPKKNDLLLTSVGTLGIPYLVKNDEVFYFKDGNLTWFRNYQSLSPKFIYYYFLSSIGKEKLNEITIGSTQKALTISGLKKIIINLPPLEEQKSIASALSSFDDKIELLRQQNKILEKIAQIVFNEWFGKYQVGDELPEGWRVGKLDEIITFTNGYAFKSKDLLSEEVENCYKVFKMGHIKKGGGFNPSKTKSYIQKNNFIDKDRYILKNGDLLMSMTDMKDAVSLLGHTALMIYENEYVVNQRVGLIRSLNSANINYPYLYLLTNNRDFIANLRGRANSGVQINLSTSAIKNSDVIIADLQTNINFNNIVRPLFDKIKNNLLHIQKLLKIRDVLLLKLINGKLKVEI